MNALLKIVVDEAIDLTLAGEDAAAKNWAGAAGNVFQAVEEAPSLVSNWADGLPELKALLVDPAADQDLVTYVQGKLTALGASAKPVAIISTAAALGIYVIGAEPLVSALVTAIKS